MFVKNIARFCTVGLADTGRKTQPRVTWRVLVRLATIFRTFTATSLTRSA